MLGKYLLQSIPLETQYQRKHWLIYILLPCKSVKTDPCLTKTQILPKEAQSLIHYDSQILVQYFPNVIILPIIFLYQLLIHCDFVTLLVCFKSKLNYYPTTQVHSEGEISSLISTLTIFLRVCDIVNIVLNISIDHTKTVILS